MARLNANYGSELHLLRMLGRHRQYFDLKVLAATGADAVDWLDFPSGKKQLGKNGVPAWGEEWTQLDFLPDDAPAKAAWAAAWPTHRTGPHWDAIGRLTYRGRPTEWLLVEAKANIEELESSCQAKDARSLGLITKTMDDTKAALGAFPHQDWIRGYYQHCNRLAALHILNSNASPARLAYIYFYGDHGGTKNGRSRICPASVAEWHEALEKQEEHIGLPEAHYLRERVHKIFVDAQCREWA